MNNRFDENSLYNQDSAVLVKREDEKIFSINKKLKLNTLYCDPGNKFLYKMSK